LTFIRPIFYETLKSTARHDSTAGEFHVVLKNGRWIVSLDSADALLTPSAPEGTPALVLDQAAPAFANAAALGKSAIAAASVIGGHAVPHASISAATIPAPTLVATGAGLKINLVWDASVANAPVSFRTAITTAAQMIEQYVTNTITLNIAIGWGEIGGYAGGQSSAVPSGVSEGGTLGDRFVSYASVRQALAAAAVSADDQSLLANLGTASPYGSVAIDVTGAQQKAFGQIAGDSTALDGEVGFATDWPSADLIAAALHELTHAMGRNSGWGSAANGNDVTLLDLARFSAPGVYANDGAQSSATNLQYFSLDGGKTVLANYATSSDYGDWASNSLTVNDPNNAFLSSNSNALTAVDIRQLDVMGFTIVGTGATLVVSGALVSAASGLQRNAQVASFSVSDSSANIWASLAALAGDSKLTAVSFTDASKPSLSLTSTAYTADAAVIAKISSAFNLTVTGATVALASALQAAPVVSAFTLSDSASNVLAGMAGLLADSKLASITLTDATKPTLSLTAAAYAADTVVLSKIVSPLGLAVTGATVSAAAALQANTKVTGFTIVDSAANILPAVAALSADSKITGITASAAQTANASVLQANAQVTSFSVLDSAANVQAALAGLLADGKLSSITLSDITKPTLTLSAADYAADAAVLAKIVSPYSLVVTGGLVTTVAGAAALQADSGVTSFTISDTAAHVQAGFTSLMADGKLSAITLTDAGTPGLAVTGAIYNAGTAVLAKITSPFVLTVSGAAVSQATKLQSDTRVTGFAVTDNAANVTAAIRQLNADSKLTGLSVSGTSGGDTLNLSGSRTPTTIDLGGDRLSYATGLNLAAPTFVYPPDMITLGAGAATINYVITPKSGIEEIANFQFGLDRLVMNLNGARASVFTAHDTSVGGVHAVSLYSVQDRYDGVVLTGLPSSVTAATILGSHTSVSNGQVIIT
jgi:hypothetical protein